MARGVRTVGNTQEEAEQSVLRGSTNLRVLRSREIDLGGLPPLRSGPLEKHWVVVVEHIDPEIEATLPQQTDPEAECERQARQLYLAMATDPELLSTGTIEEFECPECGERIQVELAARREAKDPEHVSCPECQAPLRRPRGQLKWDPIDRSPKQSPTCVFCGAKADSHEHVVPAWIGKQLGIRESLSAKDAFIAPGLERRKQDIPFANYRARVMCHSCNTEHFKHLEDAVIPLLVPMAKGISVSLSEETQALLALWANKTAIALMAASPDHRDTVPEAHAHAVRFENRVADDTWVAFFPWEGGPMISTAGGVVIEHRTGKERESYGVILTFAGLAFYVIGVCEPLAADEVLDGSKPPLLQFWPPKRKTITWPGGPPADNRILPGLLNYVPLRRGGR